MFLIVDFYFAGGGGQRSPPPISPVHGVVVVVIPRMALIWLMIMSLISPMKRSSTRPLSTISPASVSSAGTGLAKAREQTRKQTRRVLIIFSGGLREARQGLPLSLVLAHSWHPDTSQG